MKIESININITLDELEQLIVLVDYCEDYMQEEDKEDYGDVSDITYKLRKIYKKLMEEE